MLGFFGFLTRFLCRNNEKTSFYKTIASLKDVESIVGEDQPASSIVHRYRPLVRERRDRDKVGYNAEQSHQDTEEQVSTTVATMFNGGTTHNHHMPGIETDPFLKNYSASDLQTASEFLLNWLPFLSKDLCHDCSLSISNRVRSLVPRYNAEQSHQDTEKQVSTPSHRDSKYETDINDTGDTNSLGSLKDGVNGASEQIIEACRTEMLQSPEHVNGSTPRKSWADMAQGGFEADEEEEAKFQFGSFSSQVEEMGEVKVIRKKDFACYERINGKLVNIVDGLELHSNVFSLEEQRRIVDCVFELQGKGKNGKLKARTYAAPRKWMRGKGRVTIQFGCCYNYVTDRNGNPPGILHNTLVDPIPPLFKVIIKRLVKWHILPPTCVPDSCIVNIYDEGDCIPPHIDNHDFLHPFCTVSFLSECNILFGTNLKIEGPGEFSGSFPIPLPMGSVLVLNGNGADVAKHCVPAVPTKRISITFRKMDESKWPIGFVPEPDLQGLEPLPYGSDKPKDNSNLSKPKDNSNLSKPSQPSDRETVGGNDANISKPSQQLYGKAVRRDDTMDNSKGLLGPQPRFYGQSQIRRQQGPSPGIQRKARLEY